VEDREYAVLAWLRLARVFQKIDRRSEQLFRKYELNTAQFDVLAHVGASDGRSQQDLADALLVTKGNVSQLLAKLEQRGLIDRTHVRRSNFLSLTAEGRRVFDHVVPQQESQLSKLFSCLPGRDQAELVRLLRTLDHGIDR